MNKQFNFVFNGLMNYFSCKADHYFGTFYSKPISVCALVTEKCNVRCKQCDRWRIKKPLNQLSTDDWKYIIKKLRIWLGTFHIDFSGGEPLLREDVFDLITYSNKLGILTTMITNGYLIDKNLAKKIINSELDKLIISVDGIGKTHDCSRGMKGLFGRIERSLKMINDLKEKHDSKLKISINTTITRYNLREIQEIVEFATKNNCSIYFRPLLPVYSTIHRNDYEIVNELWPSNHDEVSKVIDDLIKMKKKGAPITNYEKFIEILKIYFMSSDIRNMNLTNFGIRCEAPFRYIAIKSNGDVKICGTILGNMLRDNLIDIKYKLNEFRKGKKNCGRFCGLSDYMWTINSIEIKRLWKFLHN